MQKSILFSNLEFYNLNKTFFSNFSFQFNFSQKIAIIDNNGCGKTSLLNLIYLNVVQNYPSINIQYVRQDIKPVKASHGKFLFKNIVNAIDMNPEILLLDEPNNHLDIVNKKLLIKKLSNYTGTLILVSHDVDFLNNLLQEIWHISNNKIIRFKGLYANYIYANYIKEHEFSLLKLQEQIRIIKHEKRRLIKKIESQQQKQSNRIKQGKKLAKKNKWSGVVANQKKQYFE